MINQPLRMTNSSQLYILSIDLFDQVKMRSEFEKEVKYHILRVFYLDSANNGVRRFTSRKACGIECINLTPYACF